MAHYIRKDYTILDYVEAIMLRDTVEERADKVQFISLNKAEWVQLITMLAINYNGCALLIKLSEDGNRAEYKDVHLYYDGSEETDAEEYMMHLENIRGQLNRNRNENVARVNAEPVF